MAVPVIGNVYVLTLSLQVIFQESRRIVVASYQVIIYKEFLPVLLGEKIANHKRYAIKLEDEGYFEGYDETYDPHVINEFTTAAYRYVSFLSRNKMQLPQFLSHSLVSPLQATHVSRWRCTKVNTKFNFLAKYGRIIHIKNGSLQCVCIVIIL